jgi:hypothetical protein
MDQYPVILAGVDLGENLEVTEHKNSFTPAHDRGLNVLQSQQRRFVLFADLFTENAKAAFCLILATLTDKAGRIQGREQTDQAVYGSRH